jgi:predicted membrane channel-forming protein YqfA (hemolysin III family)
MHNNLELGTIAKLNYKADVAFFIFFGLLLLPNFLPISYDLKLTFGWVVTILGFLFITLISLGFTFRKQKRGTTPTNGINGNERKPLSSGPMI